MSKQPIKDIGASIKHRLLRLAIQQDRPFDELLQYYLIERFLYRLSQSHYKNKFILKGALMFIVWSLTESRPTKDIDLLGKTENSIENLEKIIHEICSLAIPDDGTQFFTKTLKCSTTQERNTYSGIRLSLKGCVSTSCTNLQIDIGFGDVVHPAPVDLLYPTLLSMPQPNIFGYTPETLIAEKTHAMVTHGLKNSRMKDYFDIWFLSRQFSFESQQLSNAIRATFTTRKMPLEHFISQICNDTYKTDNLKQEQWNTFLSKNPTIITSQSFSEIINDIELFIRPVLETNDTSTICSLTWDPPGYWKQK